MDGKVNCQWVQQSLSAYVDGELSPEKSAEVFLHLRHCPSCQKEVKVLEFWEKAFQTALCPHPFGERLKERILTSLRRRERNSFSSFSLFTRVSVAVAALLVVGFFLLFPSTSSVSPLREEVSVVASLPSFSPLKVEPPSRGGLRLGSQVENPTQKGALLNWHDGSWLVLGPGAKVKLSGKSQVKLLQGSVFFHILQKGRLFSVKVGSARVEVLGTRFLVRAEPELLWVELYQGKVAVRHGEKRILLTQGQGLWLKYGGPFLGVYRLSQKVPSWLASFYRPPRSKPSPRHFPSLPPRQKLHPPKGPEGPTEEEPIRVKKGGLGTEKK